MLYLKLLDHFNHLLSISAMNDGLFKNVKHVTYTYTSGTSTDAIMKDILMNKLPNAGATHTIFLGSASRGSVLHFVAEKTTNGYGSAIVIDYSDIYPPVYKLINNVCYLLRPVLTTGYTRTQI